MTNPFLRALLSGFAETGVVAAIFYFWLKSYFGPYLTQKAKNLATHEDIRRLVDQVRETERIKAEISDSTWDRQARWTYKRDLYVRIVECMSTLILLECKCRTWATSNKPVVDLYREWSEQMSELLRLSEIASFVASDRAYRTLVNLKTTKDVEDPLSEEQTEKLKAHLAILRKEAKIDLGYGDLSNEEGTAGG